MFANVITVDLSKSCQSNQAVRINRGEFRLEMSNSEMDVLVDGISTNSQLTVVGMIAADEWPYFQKHFFFFLFSSFLSIFAFHVFSEIFFLFIKWNWAAKIK